MHSHGPFLQAQSQINMVKKIRDTLPSSSSNTLNSLLWSGTDAIINARDLMQNPGQTRIFYKPGQTRLTRTKRDPVDPDNPVDPTRFQPCSKHEQ